jgi:hypothetical protein
MAGWERQILLHCLLSSMEHWPLVSCSISFDIIIKNNIHFDMTRSYTICSSPLTKN